MSILVRREETETTFGFDNFAASGFKLKRSESIDEVVNTETTEKPKKSKKKRKIEESIEETVNEGIKSKKKKSVSSRIIEKQDVSYEKQDVSYEKQDVSYDEGSNEVGEVIKSRKKKNKSESIEIIEKLNKTYDDVISEVDEEIKLKKRKKKSSQIIENRDDAVVNGVDGEIKLKKKKSDSIQIIENRDDAVLNRVHGEIKLKKKKSDSSQISENRDDAVLNEVDEEMKLKKKKKKSELSQIIENRDDAVVGEVKEEITKKKKKKSKIDNDLITESALSNKDDSSVENELILDNDSKIESVSSELKSKKKKKSKTNKIEETNSRQTLNQQVVEPCEIEISDDLMLNVAILETKEPVKSLKRQKRDHVNDERIIQTEINARKSKPETSDSNENEESEVFVGGEPATGDEVDLVLKYGDVKFGNGASYVYQETSEAKKSYKHLIKGDIIVGFKSSNFHAIEGYGVRRVKLK